jgi:ribonuclease HI
MSNNVPPKQLKQDELKQSLATPVLQYDLIEDLKNLRANIYVYKTLKFPLILQKMLQNIAENSKKGDPSSKKNVEISSKIAQKIPTKTISELPNKRDLTEKTVSNVDKKIPRTTMKNQQNFVVNTRKNVPPFLLTFEIFNRNVHNYMVDSVASSNVMHLSVCQKINAEVQPSSLKIIHLDRTNIKVISELKNVMVRLSSNPKVHQIIDIIVIDIPKFYGLFLSRDLSKQLHGYFTTDWSHLWLPENGHPNKIRINRECYLKHTIIDLNDLNEPFTTSTKSFEMKGMNTFFCNFMTELSPFTNLRQQSKIMAYTQSPALPNVPNTTDKDQIWSLYFDKSKSKEGADAGCVLIDPAGNKTFISSRLEFECMNNIVEYESLLQGLRKETDMDVRNLMVFSDSEIVVRKVRNSIHFLSPHLKSYQTEVWSLIQKFSSFNINSVPRLSNSEVDLLANVASKLFTVEGFSLDSFSIELLFRPSIPNNITNWRVFDDDQYIINFLHIEDTFQGAIIDEGTHDENLYKFMVISNSISS